nr:E3 ubiquitin-protein ligase LUL4 [Ipomoea batatas]
MKHGGGGKKKPAVTDEKPADPHGRRDNLAGLTLFAVLGGGDEDDPNSAKENKKTWKHFKEKLGLKGAAWTSTAPIPASDVPIHPMSSRTMSRRVSNRFPSGEYPADEYKPELAQSASRRELRPTPSNRMSLSRNQSRSLRLQSSASIRRSRTEGEEESERGGEDGEGEGDQSGMRMSLMALLEESEGGLMMDEEEEEEGGCEDYGGEFHNCCVCMVRHKGEAFVPCGHTFCRLCSRELWAEKGNCPLCNNFILEILDIF